MNPHALPDDIACAADYSRLARARLEPATLAHLDGGSERERTLGANRAAFDALQLQPRVLVDAAHGSTRTALFGQALRHPVMLAPVGWQRLYHPDGECASAQAAAATDTGLVLSTLSCEPLEAVADCGPSPRWFQLYLQPHRADSERLLRRAEAAGYGALVLTLDTPVQTPPRQAQRLGFRLPPGMAAGNLAGQAPLRQRMLAVDDSPVFQGLMAEAPRWEDIDWLRRATSLPILAKGVTHPDDAERLVALGIDGLVVSNHGGRALDGAPAALASLRAVRARLGPGVPLLIDGGIAGGDDVFKALACGADAVLVGRLAMHALAVGGAIGLAHCLKLLRGELEVAMALTGCPTVADIGAHALFDPARFEPVAFESVCAQAARAQTR